MVRPLRRSLLALALLLPVSAAARADLIDVVNQVSLSSYQSYLDNHLYTHSGDNRGLGGAQHDLARTSIYNTFSSFGLDVALHPFTYSGSTYHNVVATRTGTTRPNDIYIIGAHYDSASNPGADDNASGVAAVLEAARVLSDELLESTVTFIAFDREEQGLIGSKAYAQAHQTDNILGMISLDMIAYNPAANHDQAHIYWHDHDSPITQDLQGALARYGDGVSGTVSQLTSNSSDHAPFDDVGKDACLLIEYNVWSNPNYHTANDSVDTLGYIDYEYATSMTRGVVGYLAEHSMTAVPEPACLSLCGIGVLFLGVGAAGRVSRRLVVRRWSAASAGSPPAATNVRP